MINFKRLITLSIAAAIIGAGPTFAAEQTDQSATNSISTEKPQLELPVAIGPYNMFRFSAPITEVLLPPKTPVVMPYEFLGDNHVLLIRFDEDAPAQDIQMVVTLSDGTAQMIALRLSPGGKGYDHEIAGKKEHKPIQLGQSEGNPNAQYIPVLKSVLASPLRVVPDGFSLAKTQKPLFYVAKTDDGRDVKVALEPLRRLIGSTNGSDVYIETYRLRVDKDEDLAVDPSQFYRPGLMAAVIQQQLKYVLGNAGTATTGPHVSNDHRPLIHMIVGGQSNE